MTSTATTSLRRQRTQNLIQFSVKAGGGLKEGRMASHYVLLRRVGASHQKCLSLFCQGQCFVKRGALQGPRKQPAATTRRVAENVTEIGLLHGEQSKAQTNMEEFASNTRQVTKVNKPFVASKVNKFCNKLQQVADAYEPGSPTPRLSDDHIKNKAPVIFGCIAR
jgi:hypothetical protein